MERLLLVVLALVTPPVVLSMPVPSVLAPSLKVTLPLGVPVPGEETDTVAVNFTLWPMTAALADDVTVVVVAAVLTVYGQLCCELLPALSKPVCDMLKVPTVAVAALAEMVVYPPGAPPCGPEVRSYTVALMVAPDCPDTNVGAGVWQVTVGGVASILNGPELIAGVVLPATSVTAPEERVTAAPSPLLLTMLLQVAPAEAVHGEPMPEVASVYWNVLVSVPRHQPLMPPRLQLSVWSVTLGAVLSILTVTRLLGRLVLPARSVAVWAVEDTALPSELST